MPVSVDQKLRICRTAIIYLAFFGVGLCVAVTGPTLLDLQRAINADTRHTVFIYTARSGGFLVGSIIGGIVLDRFSRQPLLIGSLFISGLTTILVPWSRSLVILILTMFISGCSLGCIDTGGNVWCLDMWGKKSGPFLQALHFAFGFGAFVAPLVAEPFLSPMETAENSTNITMHKDEGNPFSIEYAYAICGAFVLLVTCLFLAACLVSRVEQRSMQTEDQTGSGSTTSNRRFSRFICGTMAGFLLVYIGLEVSFGQLLTTYAVKGPLQLSKSTGSFMTSVYWGTFTAFRAVAVFWATKSSAACMLSVDLFVTVLATLMLFFFASNSEPVLWAGTAALGASTASVFPSGIAMVERNVKRVTNKMASLFSVAAAFGEMALPLIVGSYVDENPNIFLIVTLASAVASAFFFTVLFLGTRWHHRQRRRVSCVSISAAIPPNDVAKVNVAFRDSHCPGEEVSQTPQNGTKEGTIISKL